MNQDRLEFEAVAGFIRDHFLAAEFSFAEPRIRIREAHRPGPVPKQIELRRMFRCIGDRRHRILARVTMHIAYDRSRPWSIAGRFRLEHRCRFPFRVCAAAAEPADARVIRPDQVTDVPLILRNELSPLTAGR